MLVVDAMVVVGSEVGLDVASEVVGCGHMVVVDSEVDSEPRVDNQFNQLTNFAWTAVGVCMDLGLVESGVGVSG